MQYTREELETILDNHRKWLEGKAGGVKANLCGANLCGANLCGANLCEADLCKANLYGADLCKADLCKANLCKANLCKANLCEADLCGANLYGADLCKANLYGADLCKANLCGANLCGADLYGADLCKADLCKANLCKANLCKANLCEANLYGADLCKANLYGADLCGAKEIPFIPQACPDTGSFIAWKKVKGNYIVKLLISEDARRSSSTGRKCRADKASVLAIETLDGKIANVQTVYSLYDSNFSYTIGEMVVVNNFCEDRFQECAPGIHFFINRQEAVNYKY